MIFLKEDEKCPFCNSNILVDKDILKNSKLYCCQVCGQYEIYPTEEINKLDINKTASYLVYNCFSVNTYPPEMRYHSTHNYKADSNVSQTNNDKLNKPYFVYMDANIIDNWYPKTFSQRVDYILLYLNQKAHHVGQRIPLEYKEMLGVLFVDQNETDEKVCSMTRGQMLRREEPECTEEAKYMLESMKKDGVIDYSWGSIHDEAVLIKIMPKGYSRINELQKNTSNGKAVFVAMKFGNDTIDLREAIRKGVTDAGYIAIFIDEVQHNDFITPELLKHIRDSKFVVVDLTHKNNGAYFEEGYAMGLGKTVIQLCKSRKKLHFDVAQKNTIIWNTENDIPEKLTNRIKATID